MSILVLLTAQPAHCMYASLKDNPYVKYGAAVVAGISLGASLMYYFTSKPTPKIVIKSVEKDSKKETRETLVEIYLSCDIGKSEDGFAVSTTGSFWTTIENLHILHSSKIYELKHVDTTRMILLCDGTRVDLKCSPPNAPIYDIFPKPNWEETTSKTYFAADRRYLLELKMQAMKTK